MAKDIIEAVAKKLFFIKIFTQPTHGNYRTYNFSDPAFLFNTALFHLHVISSVRANSLS